MSSWEGYLGPLLKNVLICVTSMAGAAVVAVLLWLIMTAVL